MSTYQPAQPARSVADRVRDRLTAGFSAVNTAVKTGCEYHLDHGVILPGWWADDGQAAVHYPDAESAEDSAVDYVDGGSWGEGEEDRATTMWVNVDVWRVAMRVEHVACAWCGVPATSADADGDPACGVHGSPEFEETWPVEVREERVYEDRIRVTVEPVPPACAAGHDHDHDWRAPHEVVGGCEENPGVRGHGGGTIEHSVCSHCGAYRVVDTWAQDPDTGEQGLCSVEYRPADDESRAWVFRDRDAD